MAERRPKKGCSYICAKDHLAHAQTKRTKLVLVGGRAPYIAIDVYGTHGYVSGNATLRKLARAILDGVPEKGTPR